MVKYSDQLGAKNCQELVMGPWNTISTTGCNASEIYDDVALKPPKQQQQQHQPQFILSMACDYISRLTFLMFTGIYSNSISD